MAQKTPLGEMLRLYRATRNLSMTDLGKQIDLPAKTVGRLEAGGSVDCDAFLRLLTWLRGANLSRPADLLDP